MTQGPRLQALASRFRRKPFSTLLAITALVIAARLLGEFAVGFVEGLIGGFTDAV